MIEHQVKVHRSRASELKYNVGQRNEETKWEYIAYTTNKKQTDRKKNTNRQTQNPNK